MNSSAESEHQPRELLSGYQFQALDGLALKRERAQRWAEQAGLKGTVLLASEGVNFSLHGQTEALNQWLLWLRDRLGCDQLILNRQRLEQSPFGRLKVRVRPEIVTFEGAADSSEKSAQSTFDKALQPGALVPPSDWNELIVRADVQLVDTRNHYEHRLGSFEHALNPNTASFTDFQRWAKQSLNPDQPVAMFCTGGIRCEKASNWLKREGFAQVYQLKGGILSYLAHIEAAESKWQGECFVFDDRVALDHDLLPTGRQICAQCRMPVETSLDDDRLCSECAQTVSADQLGGLRERSKQQRLSKS